MKRYLLSNLLTFAFIITSNFNSNAQSNNWCLTDQLHQQRVAENPELIREMDEFEQYMSRLQNSNTKSSITYTVPVVFHVVHENGSENVPSSYIKAIMEELNRDFQKLNPDTSGIVTAFQGIIGDPDFQFRLATKDPNGNCTNGITRTFDPAYTNDARQNYRPIMWPRDNYLNIWVVKQPGAGSAAFAYLPSGSTPAPFDGIVIGYQYINPSNNQFSVTLTHEVGHYFNLFHTWGSQSGGVGTGQPGDPANCNDDDQVTDTPNTIGATGCNNPQSCGSLDNGQNYMDYSFCGSYMFTMGQVSRMQNIIPARTYRSNLVSTSNLIATGTDDASYANPACPPTADFIVNKAKECEGGTFSYTDRSFHAFANPSSFTYNWTFNGGTPATSSSQNPSIVYNTAGIYDVSLSVSLPSISPNTDTRSNLIEIIPGSGSFIAPYVEQVSEPSWPNNPDVSLNWQRDKPSGSLFQFQRSTNGYYSPPSSIYLNNFSFNGNGQFNLITPIADLTNMQAGSTFLNFQVAHAQKGSEQEGISLWISTDCGETFSFEKSWGGSTINSVPASSSSFTPADTSDWNFISYDISNLAGLDNVQFRLRFSANSGNNLWLDDIHISDSDQPYPLTVGFRKDLFGEFSLYPNPNEGIFTLEFNVIENDDVSIEIVDIIGKSIPIELTEKIQSGWNKTIIDTKKYELNEGVYFLKLNSGNQVFSKRLIIQ